MKPIITNRTLAFGNGTRRAGFELGTVEDPSAAILAAQQFECKFADLGCEPTDGVTDSEIICALRNSQYLSFDRAPNEPVETPNKLAPAAGDAEPWRSMSISDADGIPDKTADVLINMSARSEGKFANITTLGELFDFGDANEGFDVLPEIGKKTESILKNVLLAHLETSDEDDESDNANDDSDDAGDDADDAGDDADDAGDDADVEDEN